MFYVYKLYNENGFLYVGMTKQPTKRYKQHLRGGSTTSREVINRGQKISFEIVHCFKTYEEAKNKEADLIRVLNCVNKRIEGRDCKEYYKDNKDRILKKMKKYYEANKDKILIRNKEYIKKNWEDYSTKRNSKIECPLCGAKVSRQYISVHKKTARCLKSLNKKEEI